MEALFSSQPLSSTGALLVQLTRDGANPIEALARIAAHHAGVPTRGFRAVHVSAGKQHFPDPRCIEPLTALLLVRAGQLFAETRDPRDDFHVAAFLLWGLTAIHPFDDANGRTALDFAQQALMRRFSPYAPLFSSKARLDRALQPVLAALDVPNDGSAPAHLGQLQALAHAFESATLPSLRANVHFATAAQVLAASLTT
jgi:hypothetical protein